MAHSVLCALSVDWIDFSGLQLLFHVNTNGAGCFYFVAVTSHSPAGAVDALSKTITLEMSSYVQQPRYITKTTIHE